MAEIFNLRRARKAKARAEKGEAAQASRIAHGAPKPARDLARAREEQAEQRLSQHRLEDGDGKN